MTDRYHSLTVVLEHDIREDDAEAIKNAILLFPGVLSAAGVVTDLTSHMAEERARHDLGQKLLAVIYPKLDRD